ncbi:hypothetical protein AAF712_010392 [Marasmius tenuissimus]|uniref:Uncharacterized protein n=1 Tax=Marasmius tenuissimus TaxID=585030 RepID=A0ABR2ZQM9_9AGAR
MPQKPRTKSTHVRGDILVFGLQIISEDLKFITEEERQIYEDSPKSEQVTLRTLELKVMLQSSGIWRQARTGIAFSKSNRSCNLLVLATQGQGSLPSADVTEKIKKEFNIP